MSTPQLGRGGTDPRVKYAGYVGFLIAVVLAIVILAVGAGSSLLPPNYITATIIFTLLMILVGVFAQRLGLRRNVP